MIPIYCINLARRPDRWAHMIKQATAIGIDLIRVEGIDARDLPPEMLPSPDLGPQMNSTMLPGDMGCSLTHLKLWKTIADGDDPVAIILEDDCVVSPGLVALLGGEWIPADAKIIKLETTGHQTQIGPEHPIGIDGRALARLRKRHPGTSGLLLTRDAARSLLTRVHQFRDPVDQVLFNERSPVCRYLAPYQMTPAPIVQGANHDGTRAQSWAESSIRILDGSAPGGSDAALHPASGDGNHARVPRRRHIRRRVRDTLRRALGIEKIVVPFR
jgi:glycosyl transferase, family 25